MSALVMPSGVRLVRKARFVYSAPRALLDGRRKASERHREQIEALFVENMRRAAHRIVSELLGDKARNFSGGNHSGALITSTIGSWSMLHMCLGDPSLGLNPARATEILQVVVPLIAELSALTERATNAGGTL